MSNIDEIRNALSFIDPHDREIWVNTGYSVKHELGDGGFDVWDAWSQQADNYDARSARSVWKSIKTPTRTIAALFHDARANGYRPEKSYIPPPAEEQARIRAERETARLAEEQARDERRERVKHTAQRIWERAAPADTGHPYLTAKGITAAAAVAGLRRNLYQGEDNLLIPVYYNSEIVNLQSINQDGGKRFLSGGRVDGGFSVVGNTADFSDGIFMAEGFATAASIHQATGKPVVVAFNAGNMVAVAERLAQSSKLTADVPVVLAVDNDASQTGMKKALQAAAHFGAQAQVVEPEFTMAQIRQYQQENGSDAQGRPKLPSDFNDLHHLAGIVAVREKLETAFRRPETAPAPTAETTALPAEQKAAVSGPQDVSDEEWAKIAADEAKLSGYPVSPVPPATQTADTEAVSLQEQEQQMSSETELKPVSEREHEAPVSANAADTTDRPSENSPANSIEYAALRQNRKAEPTPNAEPEQERGQERTATEPSEDAGTAKDAPARKQETDGHETVVEAKTEAETENGSGDTPEPETEHSPALETKKPVTDLNYRIPPDSIANRYVVAEGKYLSAANHTTVIFTDSGKKISTAKTDMQTINDMLEVAQEKSWDSIKISGNKEFKAMMYVAAESRGIRTTGYRPTPEDLALLDRMRQERSLNGIEAQPRRTVSRAADAPAAEKVAPVPFPGDKRQRLSETPAAKPETAAQAEQGERIVKLGTAHYLHDPEKQLSPYIVLERGGKERTVWGVDIPDAVERSGAEVGDRIRLHRLGKQPVEIEAKVYDKDGKVTGTEVKEVERNLFRIEILQSGRGQKQAERQNSGPEHGKPDVEMLSKADKLTAQSSMPSAAAINVSEAADTQQGVPLQAVGHSEIPSEAAIQAGRMKNAALEVRYISAKAVYADKAAKLSKPNKAHLEWHERNVLDTIRGLKGEARTLALTNYYEATAKQMSGPKLKLPKPVQIPAQSQSMAAQQRTERTRQAERSQEKAPEMEVGR